MDKVKSALLAALRLGSDGAEQRLYRSGKLPGMFSGRTSVNADAAALGLRDGLIEIVRTETKGKTITEWVRVTPSGVAFLIDNESPLKALEDLHAVLRHNQEALPQWLADLQTRCAAWNQRLLDEFQGMARTLDRLARQVVEALQRAEKMGPALPPGAAGALPWGNDAVSYVEQRRRAGVGERCPFPELFAAVCRKTPDLTIHDFHSGLRRLHDRGVVRLLPYDEEGGPPEPEYAFLDGAAVYYYAAGLAMAG